MDDLDPELSRYNLGDEDFDVLVAEGVTVDGVYHRRRRTPWQQALFTIKPLEDDFEDEMEMGHAAWRWSPDLEVDEQRWLEAGAIMPVVTAVTQGN